MNHSDSNRRENEDQVGMPNDEQPQAGPKEWIGLAVLALPTLLMAIDISVLYLALPHLAADLGPNGTQMLWIVDIYGFMIAGFLIIMSKLGDRIGRRRLLMIGAGAFGIASILAAYSISAEMLIVTRALLGVAGATLMPSTLSLISNMFRNPKQRSLAVSIWMMCLTVGSVIGPIIGGMMLEKFWWGSVFLLGVPVMVLLLLTAPFLLPEYRDTKGGRLDIISAVLSLAAILSVVYGIKNMTKEGLQWMPVLIIGIGAAIGWVFVRRQRKVADPLLDLRLFRSRTISSMLCIMLLGLIIYGGLNLNVSQYLQLVQGLSPLLAGLWLIPLAAGVITGSIAAPLLTRRIPPAYVIGTGLLVAAAGCLVLAQVDSAAKFAYLVTGSVVAAIGISPLLVLGTDLIIGSAPPEKAGSVSALSETSSELGIALGIALMGSITTSVYQNQVGDFIPQDIPQSVADAVLDSLAGAIATADQIPASVSAGLLDSARMAFTSGMNAVAWISFVIIVLLAVLSVIFLRQIRPSGKLDNTAHDSSEKQMAEG